MNTLLWIGQGFLALLFLYSGFCKSMLPQQRLVALGQTGVDGLPVTIVRFIGVSELLGATGLVLPWATGIAPALTPTAAVCFTVIMILAAPIHYRRGEYKSVSLNGLVGLLSLAVALGRGAQLYHP
jgi:uncharacterized membrane protein YphA (DoxX/SURF4 family)